MPMTAKLKTKIPEIVANLGPERELLARASVERMEITARAHCPKDTGSLDETIAAVQDHRRGDRGWALIAGDTSGGYTGRSNRSEGKVDYAMVQEFGGAHSPAHPFIRPAVQQEIAIAPGQMLKQLWAFYNRFKVS